MGMRWDEMLSQQASKRQQVPKIYNRAIFPVPDVAIRGIGAFDITKHDPKSWINVSACSALKSGMTYSLKPSPSPIQRETQRWQRTADSDDATTQRSLQKLHEITDSEWRRCLDLFSERGAKLASQGTSDLGDGHDGTGRDKREGGWIDGWIQGLPDRREGTRRNGVKNEAGEHNGHQAYCGEAVDDVRAVFAIRSGRSSPSWGQSDNTITPDCIPPNKTNKTNTSTHYSLLSIGYHH